MRFLGIPLVDKYILVLALLGLAMLGMAWVPGLTKRVKVSYSIIYVLFGMALYSAIPALPSPNPFRYLDFTVHITELVVIISLMGSGLKIDEPFAFRSWRIPFRLVSISMALNILVVTLLGFYLLDLSLASSLLVAAVLAPTDPVLAGDVQVGPPLERSKSDVKFTLTAEAGLNDGMAFPFVWLAITVALRATTESSLFEWFLFDFLYRIGAGFIIGYLSGKAIAYLVFSLPQKRDLMISRDGFIAISSTLLVYGLTEMASGYGFVAVFVCAVTIRNHELEHEFHIELHSFTDQVERMLMAIVLLLFGGTLVLHVLPDISWMEFLFAAALVFLVRPITSVPSVFDKNLHRNEKAVISFYGIRGIGSFFYLSFALQKAQFEAPRVLWDLVCVVVFLSILVHGFSATTVIQSIDRQFPKTRKPER